MVTQLKLSGLTCNTCVKHVKQALEAVPGVELATVDLASQTAEVTGDASNERLIAAVEEEGYDVLGASVL